MPFDETTIEGCMVSLILQTCAGYSFLFITMSIILFYLGFYFYNEAFLKDFQYHFDRIDYYAVQSKTTAVMHMMDVLQFHEKCTR